VSVSVSVCEQMKSTLDEEKTSHKTVASHIDLAPSPREDDRQKLDDRQNLGSSPRDPLSKSAEEPPDPETGQIQNGQMQFDQNRAVSFSARTLEEWQARSASRGMAGIVEASVMQPPSLTHTRSISHLRTRSLSHSVTLALSHSLKFYTLNRGWHRRGVGTPHTLCVCVCVCVCVCECVCDSV